MFDIGFPELLIVSVVALLVIGPDKLPETLRTLALWLGRIRRGLANIKMELEQELGADEIRQTLHNESIMKELNEAKKELGDIVNNTSESLSEIKNAARTDPTETAAPAKATELPTPDDGKRQSESNR